MNRLRAVLALPLVARLLASALVARLPLGMTGLAIVLVVRERGGSFALAGLTAGLFTFATAASSPVYGGLIPRFGAARVVSVTAIAQSVVLCTLGVVAQAGASPTVLIGMAVVAGALVPPISACSRSLWPKVVRDASLLDAAYALDAMSQELLWTSGPLLVGLATAVDSAVLGVWLSGLFTLLGGLWFASATPVRGTPRDSSHRGFGRTPLSSPAMWILLAAMMCLGISTGAVTLGLTALASHLGAPAAAGALLGMLSAGSIIGGLVYGSRTWVWPAWWRFRALLGLGALLVLPLVAATTFATALVFALVAGLGWSAVISSQLALVNTTAIPGTSVEAFSWNTSALVVGIALGTYVAGVVVGPLGLHAAFIVSATICLIAGAITFVPVRHDVALQPN